jgi:hypothetical protein
MMIAFLFFEISLLNHSWCDDGDGGDGNDGK